MREKRCLDDKPEGIEVLKSVSQPTSPNTAYTLRAYALALRDIAPFGCNVVYAGNVNRKGG